jgi:hypothetical protein
MKGAPNERRGLAPNRQKHCTNERIAVMLLKTVSSIAAECTPLRRSFGSLAMMGVSAFAIGLLGKRFISQIYIDVSHNSTIQ